ncbi:MAG: hypothetical protein AABW64_01435 [Nanoarchaeota archaeon]
MERSKLSQSLYGVIFAVVSYASLGALPEQKNKYYQVEAVLMPSERAAQGALESKVYCAPRARSKEIFNELKIRDSETI